MEKPVQAALGVDVGGTKVNLGLISQEGQVLHSAQFPMTRLPVQEWTQLLEREIDCMLETSPVQAELLGIGLACRGIVNYTQQTWVKSTILPVSPDFNICQELSDRFHTDVMIENDVKAAAVGESLFGAGKKYDSFACINIGTGIGVGIIIQHTLWHGTTDQAGEVHTSPFFREDGTLDQLEELVSGSGIVKEIHRLRASYPSSALGEKECVTGDDLFRGAQEGDCLARAVLDNLMRALAIEMLMIENLLDLGHYVFFGGVTSNPQFMKELQQTLSDLCRIGFRWNATMEESSFGAKEAGLIGASSLILKNTQAFHSL